MNLLTTIFLWVVGLETLIILFLSNIARFGETGQKISEICTKAPCLDLIVSLIIWLPWVGGSYFGGWLGFLTTFAAQILVMQGWILIHESLHQEAVKGPRIVKFVNQKFGWWRNHLALWATAIALPAFVVIRFAEFVAYPVLVWVLDFPSYKHSEWVNVSRHKFEGLVGHDLIWCLYCDWMTGVYSLGAEMLRNVESFWCPIRFYDGKKCENCKIDFPDIEGGWVDANGTMRDVEAVLKQQYQQPPYTWFGYPKSKENPEKEN
jgi:hypothetical protein